MLSSTRINSLGQTKHASTENVVSNYDEPLSIYSISHFIYGSNSCVDYAYAYGISVQCISIAPDLFAFRFEAVNFHNSLSVLMFTGTVVCCIQYKME